MVIEKRHPSGVRLLNMDAVKRPDKSVSEYCSTESHFVNEEVNGDEIIEDKGVVVRKRYPEYSRPESQASDLGKLPEKLNGVKRPQEEEYKHSFWKNPYVYFLVFLGFFSLMALPYIVSDLKNFDVNPVKFQKDLLDEFLLIRKTFSHQKLEVWSSFLAGIENVRKGQGSIAVYLLLHGESGGNTAECLARVVARTAVRFVNGTFSRYGESPPPLHLEASVLNDLNPASQLVDYRNEVTRVGVMLVSHLERISGRVAKFFHSFCDAYNPMVIGSAYFFVLKVPSDLDTIAHSNLKAEETMKRIWRDEMTESELLPLITRMTSFVVEIQPESSLPETCTS